MPSAAPRPQLFAVVAAFRPDEGLIERVRRLGQQVDRVVVVDDGSDPTSAAVLDTIAREDGVDVILLGRNRGIAAALNTGTRVALAAGANAVLTLDQDSVVDAAYADAALSALARLRAEGRRLAVIAAGVQSGHSVRPVRYDDRGERLTPTLEAIQSGLVIPAVVIRLVGEFDEGLFIDCVDTDFVLRAATSGVPTYLARDCAIDHPLGRLVETKRVRVTRSGQQAFAFHPAWRRYYISRNRVVVFARYAAARPDWVAVGLLGETVQLARCLLFGPAPLSQAAAVALGVADAIRGRRGRLDGAAARLLGAPADTIARLSPRTSRSRSAF